MTKPELPILAQTLKKLDQLEHNPQLSAKSLADVLALDPALALSVLHHAVHLPRRRMYSPITTLLHAAMMMGIGPIRRLARELPIAENALQQKYVQGYKTALARAALSGRLGSFIAHERRELEPGEIALASLFFSVGELTLWTAASEQMHEFERLSKQPGVHPQEAAYITFGTSIGDLSHTLVEAWGLPRLLQETLDPHQALSIRDIGPLLATRLARHSMAGWAAIQAQIDLKACSRHLELDLSSLIHQLDELLLSFNKEVPIFYDITEIPSLIGPAVQKPPQTLTPVCCQAPDLDRLKLGEQRLFRAKTRNDITNTLLETCYSGLGMNRVIFGLRTEDADGHLHLHADSLSGADYDYGLHRFSLPIHQDDLFGLLMRKPAAVWVRGTQTPKFIKLFPKQAQDAVQTDHFFCGSLFENSTPLGVIYADRRQLECALTATQFTSFKRLVALANKRLAQLLAHNS
ncbi:HDOD domain-containing protein [Acidihalobacter ferrooxydans]|uniref:HDOD domain-containing protein n=1 Tax=Acidihalobacter ferrooxydans TaxID=1765967 RepID=A0A1P8UGQ1_9GAMM|nr:HDOD domain-containing protein [Acidihalobacter ferrooxydans]APZ42980.1 hypothetical protein BW247_07640 [Acidihalobacter ferrooxydans]